MLHLWVVIRGRQLLQLAMVSLSLVLFGCYKWEALDKPLSGVSLTIPKDTLISPGSMLVFSGSLVANLPAKLSYGLRYQPRSYELYQARGYGGFSTAVVKNLDPAQTTFADSIALPDTALPGRYRGYSVLTDTKGRLSDSVTVFKTLLAADVYPTILPQLPWTKTEAATVVLPGARISLSTIGRDSAGLDSLVVRFCQVLDSGRVACTLLRSVSKNGRATTDTIVAEIPPLAVSGQQYRIRIKLLNNRGFAYIWQPLFSIQ